ncbi:MAG: hypothetical protein PHQ36_07775 [Anaerolineales bacterium]|nr:hypothetical protein [Anaerolineales bacterium]
MRQTETERLAILERALNNRTMLQDAILSLEQTDIRPDIQEELKKELQKAEEDVKAALLNMSPKREDAT